MKRIWTKAVWQMTDDGMEFLPAESDSFDYDGPIAEAKKGGSPPPPPDPYQVAGAQTQQNRDAALYNAALNRVNTYTPLGSQTFNITGTDPRTGAPIYEQRIELSPEQQQLYDQQQQQNLALGNVAQGMLGRVGDTYGSPVDTSGLPQLQGNVDVQGPSLQGGFRSVDPRMGVDLTSQYQTVSPQQSLDRTGLPSLPSDLQGFRDEAERALYDRNTAYLDDRFARGEESLRSRLANQGIVEGSEAYKNAIDDFERGREMAYRQARNESIAGGGAEASRMFDIGSRARGQLFGEELSSGQFGNQAAGQETAQNLAAAQFGNQAALAGGQFSNQAAGQATAQNMASAQFGNQARQQALAEALASGGFANQARGQGMSELFALRNQPLNEFNALRSASPVNMPQFQGMAQVGTNPADIAGAIQNNYQGQLDIYNAQQQGRNSLLGTLGGLGSAAMFAFSDERLKDDIEPIGELNDGTTLYSYRYKGDPAPQVGVMAQEIEKKDPSAVRERFGYKQVNYAKVLANALEAA